MTRIGDWDVRMSETGGLSLCALSSESDAFSVDDDDATIRLFFHSTRTLSTLFLRSFLTYSRHFASFQGVLRHAKCAFTRASAPPDPGAGAPAAHAPAAPRRAPRTQLCRYTQCTPTARLSSQIPRVPATRGRAACTVQSQTGVQ